jgi:hypothetical protein
MSRSGTLLLAFALLACGSVDQGMPDAPVGPPPDAPASPPDASPPDASPPDAAPAVVHIESALDFPSPHGVLGDFSAAELAAAGATGGGFNMAFGSLTGNPTAPFTSPFISMSSPTQIATFSFTTPLAAVGIGAADIDFGNDSAVIIRVAGLDAAGTEIASHQRAMLPANSLNEENANAIFVGFSSSTRFTTVRITIDQANSTAFDNLRYQAAP